MTEATEVVIGKEDITIEIEVMAPETMKIDKKEEGEMTTEAIAEETMMAEEATEERIVTVAVQEETEVTTEEEIITIEEETIESGMTTEVMATEEIGTVMIEETGTIAKVENAMEVTGKEETNPELKSKIFSFRNINFFKARDK